MISPIGGRILRPSPRWKTPRRGSFDRADAFIRSYRQIVAFFMAHCALGVTFLTGRTVYMKPFFDYLFFVILLSMFMAPSWAGELKIGDRAPDFELQGSDGNLHRLKDYRGRVVVLAWFPKAFTGG
jgi:hypothetical protein